MQAILYTQFQSPPLLETVPDPAPPPQGVVIKVEATGLCRSDWHGWMGHDPDIRLPHVPGHELAGTIIELGSALRATGPNARWRVGDRVTLPFVCGCGHCAECAAGHPQVCPNQFQPGFTHWGSFAEFVAIDYAEHNLVALSDGSAPATEPMDFETAASLGCRFATSFRAIVAQGRVRPGEWVAVHGCGGVGLSAIMIATALGASVIAIDIDPRKLAFARTMGALATIDVQQTGDVPAAIHELTRGGAHVSLDALGSAKTAFNSIAGLRRRGRHVQVGLTLAADRHPAIPMDRVIGWELEIYGSHGMAAHAYPEMLRMIVEGKLSPQRLIQKRITLKEAIPALMAMDSFEGEGITVVDRLI